MQLERGFGFIAAGLAFDGSTGAVTYKPSKVQT